MNIETKNLRLILQTREAILGMIEQMDPHEKKELSPAWLALIEGSSSADPWVHGFELVHRAGGTAVGRCGFKGPPGADGVVEIAYGIAPEHQGNGYATEAAEALVRFAFSSGRVHCVRAHTRPELNASTRVLVKCGFKKVGEAMDPDDGLVWKWEKSPSFVAKD